MVAEKALAPARNLLSRYGVPHTDHVELGDRADTITRVAEQLGVAEIVMGTARKNSLSRLRARYLRARHRMRDIAVRQSC